MKQKFSNYQIPITNKGFTLVELMVAIAIVTILATIGFALFQNTQSQARDSRRKQDIDAMATAAEQKFNPSNATFAALAATDFSAGVVPTDPLNSGVYVYSGTPAAGAASFVICTRLENATGNFTDNTGATTAPGNGNYYCRKNQQQ